MSEQLHFPLPHSSSFAASDFFVSPANDAAYRMVTGAEWPLNKALLIGPAGSGKTHLAVIWAQAHNAQVFDACDTLPNRADASHVVVENAHTVARSTDAQTALFHLHNNIAADGGHLLLTATSAVSAWGLSLADLASRMGATFATLIGDPDEALLTAVLTKQLADRQIRPAAAVIDTLVRNMTRSFDAARALVQALDDRGLAEGRALTAPLARQVLADLASAQD